MAQPPRDMQGIIDAIRNGDVDLTDASSMKMGQDADGTMLLIRALAGGGSTPVGIDLAVGRVDGYVYADGNGRNPEVDIVTTPEDIIGSGGLYTGHPVDAPTSVTVVTDNAADDPLGGAGARTVEIVGLKTATSEEIESEVLDIGGISASVWHRIFRSRVASSGSNGSNTGTLTVQRSGDPGVVFGTILPTMNVSHDAVFTVPHNRQAAIFDKILTIGRDSAGDGGSVITMRTRSPEQALSGLAYEAKRVYDFTNESAITGSGDTIVLTAGTDLVWRVESVTVDNCSPGATFPMVIITPREDEQF